MHMLNAVTVLRVLKKETTQDRNYIYTHRQIAYFHVEWATNDPGNNATIQVQLFDTLATMKML